jgi:hypothetical protein
MTIRELRTPPLRPDADPERSVDYATRLASARTTKEIVQIHREFADLRMQRGLRKEISDLIHAPKGSAEAKARDKLGISLILFGIFGVSLLFFAVVLIGGAIIALF